MAVYINESRNIEDNTKPFNAGLVRDYFIDVPTDINLINVNEISKSSTAFCPATKQAWALMTSGWELI